MTLGFLVLRKGYLKVTGALIQAAIERGHDLVLFWDPEEAKAGERVAPEDLAAWPAARVVAWSRRTPLTELLRAERVRALVGPTLYSVFRAFGLDAEADRMKAAGVRLYSVDYGLDTAAREAEGYRLLDATFYATAWQRELHWRVRAADFARIGDRAALEGRSAVVGSTMLDQLAVVDRAAVRKRHGLDGRRVVLFLSLKMGVPNAWRRFVWGRGPRPWRAARAALAGRLDLLPEIWHAPAYRDLVEAVKRLCARSGAALVVKSRAKNADPPFLADLADVLIKSDRDVFPYTSMQLMAIANLCVHFQSAGVLEAAFAGVPSLSVRVSQDHLRGYPTYEPFYGAAADTLQNFDGVVWSADPREAIAHLDAATLADFRMDADRRRAYVERFVGFDDTRSSERALDEIERRAAADERR